MSADDELGEFCRTEWPRLVRSLTLYTGEADLAEELAQDSLLRVCMHWPRVREADSPSAWAHRVAFNLAKSQYRRRASHRRARRLQVIQPEVVEPELASNLALRQAVLALPVPQRAALALRYFADLSVHEAAELLGCPENTLRTHTRRAIEKLREAGLIDEPVEDPPVVAGDSA
jgi:RNA polymerase sigma factor (sigma-70 family)